MSDNNDKDQYGFENINFINTEYIQKPRIKVTKTSVGITILISVIVLFLLLSVISGYYSWNEFPQDPPPTKVLKSGLAMLFPYFYLPYLFLKIVIFSLA